MLGSKNIVVIDSSDLIMVFTDIMSRDRSNCNTYKEDNPCCRQIREAIPVYKENHTMNRD
jgi:hypothetical protein